MTVSAVLTGFGNSAECTGSMDRDCAFTRTYGLAAGKHVVADGTGAKTFSANFAILCSLWA